MREMKKKIKKITQQHQFLTRWSHLPVLLPVLQNSPNLVLDTCEWAYFLAANNILSTEMEIKKTWE